MLNTLSTGVHNFKHFMSPDQEGGLCWGTLGRSNHQAPTVMVSARLRKETWCGVSSFFQCMVNNPGTPERRRTKASLAHHQRTDLKERSVFFRRVGTIEAQSPGSGKIPVVLSESLPEPLGMCPAIVWGAAVEGREIVMLP